MFSTPQPNRGLTPRRNGGTAANSARSSRAATPAGGRASMTPFKPSAAPSRRPHSVMAARQSFIPSVAGSVMGDTKMRDSPVAGATEEARGMMMAEQTLLVKDDLHNVEAFARLPAEVIQLLESADPYNHAITASLDTETGYAYLVTRQQCFVWSFAGQRGFASPTCYTFPVPSASGSGIALTSLPLAALVPRASGREPSLLLVSLQGQVRFWSSVAASIAGGDSSQELAVALGAGETVTALQQCQNASFALSTSQSRLFNISVSSQGGRLAATLSPFHQPRGILGRLFGSASSFTLGTEGTFALAAAPAPDNDEAWNVYSIAQRSVQKWSLIEGASEKLLGEQDLRQLIASATFDNLDKENGVMPEWVAMELLSAAVTNEGKLAILFSHSPSATGLRSFGLAVVDLPNGASSFIVLSSTKLQYRAHEDPRPYSTPRLVLPNGGPTAFIVFPETVLMRVLEHDFEERVALRDASRNRFLGFGAELADVASEDVAAVSLLTVRSGTLLLRFVCSAATDLSARLASTSERTLVCTERLKAKLDQAVFFGQGTLNPISFEITSPFEGDLIMAAEEVSDELVTSASPALGEYVDLRHQLAARLMHARNLIGCIDANGLLGKLSQSSRRRLCADAELLAAASDLWEHLNIFAATARRTARSENPLAESIQRVIADLGEGFGEDVVRFFFRRRLEYIVRVFEELLVRVKSAGTLEARSFEVLEANTVLLTSFQAAARYRRETKMQYDYTTAQSTFESWTSKAGALEVLEALFHATEALIRERTRELGSTVDAGVSEMLYDGENEDPREAQRRMQLELKSQLCELTTHALAAYEERIAYLRASAGAGDQAAHEREAVLLEAKYRAARPQMILPILSLGRPERAFALAERHEDFRTLTELCHQPGLPREAGQQRIRTYLERYRKAFAFQLFQWYVEQGKLRTLLEQEESEDELLSQFLEASDTPRIAWLHDIKLKRYDEACDTLLQVANVETTLSEKKLMLSLGKLAFVAELKEEQLASSREQAAIEAIDDDLDLVNEHATLVDYLLTAVPDATRDESAADPITEALTTKLADLRALRQLFTDLTRRLLRGEVMSSEDLIDLLTLKDAPGESKSDYGTAIDVFVRIKDLPQARKDMCQASIWLRTILNDDWYSITDTTSISDDELTERLRSTALYETLVCVEEQVDRAAAILEPEACLVIPTHDVLTGRMKGIPAQNVELLIADHTKQVDQLTDLLEGPVQLRKWYEEVYRLVQAHLQEESMVMSDAGAGNEEDSFMQE